MQIRNRIKVLHSTANVRTAFQLLYANFFTFFPVKTVFLISLLIFEVGSLVCAAAPTSTALVVGRAVAGLGSAGLFTGGMTAIAQVAPMEKRPMIIGLVSSLFGLSAVIGPLVCLFSTATFSKVGLAHQYIRLAEH